MTMSTDGRRVEALDPRIWLPAITQLKPSLAEQPSEASVARDLRKLFYLAELTPDPCGGLSRRIVMRTSSRAF